MENEMWDQKHYPNYTNIRNYGNIRNLTGMTAIELLLGVAEPIYQSANQPLKLRISTRSFNFHTLRHQALDKLAK